MSLVILLTGKQGSGKSYLARNSKETATIIEVDRLLVGSTDSTFGNALRRMKGSIC